MHFETTSHKVAIDYVGMGLLAIWVGAFQVILDNGEDLAWFDSPLIWALSAVSAIAFVIFIIWEFTDRYPAMNLGVFAYRGFSVSCAVMFFGFGAFFAALVLLPLWLQLGLNYTARQAGVILAMQGLLGLMTAPIAAGLMKRFDARLLMSLGLSIIATAIFFRGDFPSDLNNRAMWLPQLALGIGIPFLFIPLMTVSLAMVPEKLVTSASGTLNFVRTIAAAIATAVVVSGWNRTARIVHAILATRAALPFEDSGSEQALPLNAGQALAVLEQAVWQQSLTIAFNNLSLIIAGILFLTAGCVWIMPKPNALGLPSSH